MADYNQNKAPMAPIPKSALNEYKLRLIGPIQEGARRPPTLSVSVIKNQPRLSVATNIPNDQNSGWINAPMDALTFMAFLAELEKVINGPSGEKLEIVNKTGRPGDTRIMSYTLVGKDNEGRVFISVTAPDRPKIKFTFLPTEYHTIIHKDGTPYSEAELSVAFAKAWHSLMVNLVPNVLNTYYVEPEPRENTWKKGGDNNNRGGYNKQGGNTYGGGSGGGGNSGGGAPSGGSNDFDDGFPM